MEDQVEPAAVRVCIIRVEIGIEDTAQRQAEAETPTNGPGAMKIVSGDG